MEITYKWKTYQLDEFHSDIVLERMKEWWYELQPQEEKTEETNYCEHPHMTINWKVSQCDNCWERFNHEPSILQKLKEELERRIHEQEWSTPYMEVKWELEEVLCFLNELEKETQLETISCKSTEWSPTPWELIEVSNDGEEWEEREFYGIGTRLWEIAYYCVTHEKDKKPWASHRGWQYARPIKKVDTVPVLPEMPKSLGTSNIGGDFINLWNHTEAMTHAVNYLLKKAKN